MLFHHTAIKHKMNMALQKFAHGATHYCKFKHTALCENALHCDNKTTINKQILCRFRKQIFSKIKKLKHTFLSSNVLRLVRYIFELKHSSFQPFYLQRTRKLHRLPFFFTLMCFLRKALDNIDLNQMSHRYVSGALQND